MAEIEYAVLAQFASVADDGSLTVVGGHRTTFEVAGTPGQHVLCVAGRVLLGRREPPPVLSLGALTPDGDVPVVARWPLEVHDDVPMEDGRRPAAFAATLVAPAPTAGPYALTLLVNDVLVRTLPFTVVDSTQRPGPEAPTAPAHQEEPGPVPVPVLSHLTQVPRTPPPPPAPTEGEPVAAEPTARRHGRRAARPEPARG